MSAARAYEPLPGSIPDRAIAHLRTLDAGAALSTSALAEAIEVDSKSLVAALDAARRRGALQSVRRQGTLLLFWSLGTGVPLPARPVDEDDDIKRPELPAGAPVPPSVFHLANLATSNPGLSPREQIASMSAAARGRAEKVAEDDEAMRIALWSDGALEIRRPGGETTLFTKAETQQLIAYLDSISLGAVEGAS
jgi:hypothetical protein